MNADWRYSYDRMELRQQVFMSLKDYLNEYPRAVYEFSHDWVSQGNNNLNNLETCFKWFLQELNIRGITEQYGDLEEPDTE